MCLYCISPAPVDGRKGKMRSVGPALLFLPFEVDLLAPLFFSPTAFFFLPSFCLVFFFFSFLTRAECSFPPFLQPLFSTLSARRPPFLQGACVCLTSYRKKKNVRVRARLSLLLAHFISSLFLTTRIYIHVCRLCCGDHVSHAVSPPPPPPIL